MVVTTHCEKVMLLVDATFFMLFFRIFPWQWIVFKFIFLIVSNSFTYIHRLRISLIRVRINDFIFTPAVLFIMHNLAISIFVNRLFANYKCGVIRFFVISEMGIRCLDSAAFLLGITSGNRLFLRFRFTCLLYTSPIPRAAY